MRKRLTIAAVILPLLGGILAVTWIALDWPPPRLVLRYGLPACPSCPAILARDSDDQEFLRIPAGYCKVRRIPSTTRIELPTRLSNPFDRIKSAHDRMQTSVRYEVDRWFEVRRPFLISVAPVPSGLLRSFGEPNPPEDGEFPALANWTLRFCRWLSDRNAGDYRLPTESELYLAFSQRSEVRHLLAPAALGLELASPTGCADQVRLVYADPAWQACSEIGLAQLSRWEFRLVWSPPKSDGN